MRLALFGGTFDPVHVAHLRVAESARESAGLSRVIFLPTFRPPHKPSPEASARDRLAMLRLAVRDHAAFEVSDWEVRQARTVYTIETLTHFRAARPRVDWHFVIGSDSLRDLLTWKDGERLSRLCRFLVLERPDVPLSKLPARLRRRARAIPMPPLAISSHDVRARVKARKSIRYLVPPSVERYIAAHGLYRA